MREREREGVDACQCLDLEFVFKATFSLKKEYENGYLRKRRKGYLKKDDLDKMPPEKGLKKRLRVFFFRKGIQVCQGKIFEGLRIENNIFSGYTLVIVICV